MNIENKKELAYHVKHAAEIIYNSLPACYTNNVSLEKVLDAVTSDEVLSDWQRSICMYCEKVLSERE